MKRLSLLCAIVAMSWSHAGYASTVSSLADSGPGSLREAIVGASPGEVITFSVTGTIVLTTGELFIDKDLTIVGPGPDDLTVLRSGAVATPEFRIFAIDFGIVAGISGLTIKDGRDEFGAGIYSLGTVGITNCVIMGNKAGPLSGSGGGIQNESGAMTIKDCSICGNEAAGTVSGGLGGGVANVFGGTLSILNSSISSNMALEGLASGGGIYSDSSLKAEFSYITDNVARGGVSETGQGGGVAVSFGADLSLENVVVSGNMALGGDGVGGGMGAGGGIFLDSATLVLSQVTVSANSSAGGSGSVDPGGDGKGGGIANVFGSVLLTNVTVSGNSVLGGTSPGGAGMGAGAGIHNDGGTVGIRHSTVTANTVPAPNPLDGGGLHTTGGGTVEMKNSILAGNTASFDFVVDSFGALASEGYNLIGTKNMPVASAASDVFDVAPGSLLLGPLAANGGFTPTHAISCGSLAINAGGNADAPPFDQRGFARIVDGIVDVGSYEAVGAAGSFALDIIKFCPTNAVFPGDLLVFSGTVSNAGDVTLTNIVIVNDQPGPSTAVTNFAMLEPGQSMSFFGSYEVSSSFSECVITDTLTATGMEVCGGSTVTATGSATCPIQHLLLVECPPVAMVQCFVDVPDPAPGSLIINSTAGGVTAVHEGDSYVTNACKITVSRTFSVMDACGNTTNCVQSIEVLDTEAPMLVGVPGPANYQCLSDVPEAMMLTATDNCSLDVMVGVVAETNGVCPTLVIYTWTATDACGNTEVASQTNTVLDTEAPMLVGVPGPADYQCLSDVPEAMMLTATDNCSQDVMVGVVAETNGVCPTLVIYTWTATDACGNTEVASQTNTVLDTEAPMLVGVPGPADYQCLSEVPEASVLTATDNCSLDVMVRVVAETNGVCPTLVIYTWTATDDCGNTEVASQTNTVLDTEAPMLVGVPGPADYQCLSDVPEAMMLTATDNCSQDVMVGVVAETNGVCPTLVIYTWTATDDCGNTEVASQTNTVLDTEAPMLVGVPGPADYQCLSDVPEASVLTARDNCSLDVMVRVVAETNGVCPTLVIYTWTATDDCGNTVVASQTNTVLDTEAPMLVGVPGPADYQCLSEVPEAMDLTATDNCQLDVMVGVVAETNGICPVEVVYTWTATDGCGNTAVASQTNTVLDAEAPMLVGVPGAADYQCLSEVPEAMTLTATDNCSLDVMVGVVAETNGVCPTVVIYTWTAVDDCGNTAVASQTNTVLDTEAPMLVGVPGPADYQCLSEVPEAMALTATDNCSVDVMVGVVAETNGVCPTVVIYTWTATDGCGNTVVASQTNTVLDTEAPMLVGVPGAADYQCLSEVPEAMDLTATDNCQLDVMVGVVAETNGICPVEVVYTWTATDGCGNTAVASQTNTVLDTEAPMLVGVPGAADYQCLSEVPEAMVLTATDNCQLDVMVGVVAETNGVCPTVVIYTWTATDGCGNTVVASQTNTVLDAEAPMLVGVPGAADYQCLSEVPEAMTLTATDNCSLDVMVGVVAETNGVCPTLVIYTWTATDDCGNTAVASQTNTVLDTEAPMLVGVPGATDYQCLSDVPQAMTLTATDNCSLDVMVGVVAETNGVCPTVVIYTWTATDGCGNTAVASQTNTVLDAEAPMLVGVPGAADYQCLSEVPEAMTLTATDNCSLDVMVGVVAETNGVCPTLVIYTWTATDDCGNTAVASQTNTVLDTEAPMLVGVPGATDYQCLSDVPQAMTLTATDNCSLDVMVGVVAETNGVCPTVVIYTWTATDGCGNTAVASQTNTVLDTEAPMLVGVPGAAEYQCLSEVPEAMTLTATDNCSLDVMVGVVAETNGVCPTLVIYTWTATDGCGNTAVASQTNTVLDTEAPMLVGVPGAAEYQCLSEVPEATVLTATDNCSLDVMVGVVAETNGVCPTVVIYTWTATDGCGNTAVASQTNTVLDTEAPMLVGVPGATDYQCLSDVPQAMTLMATDNCSLDVMVGVVAETNGVCPTVVIYTWTATDGCGNTAVASQTNTVLDTEAPMLVGVPGATDYQCLSDVPEAMVLTATDNCSVDVMVGVVAETNGVCPTVVVYTWTATDGCGNTAVASQTNTVLDTEAPMLVGVSGGAEFGCLTDVPPPPTVTAFDDCDAEVVVRYESVTNGICPAFVVREWSATDRCGNRASIHTTNKVECADFCLDLIKVADRSSVLPGGIVNYSYTVTNCGCATVTDVEVMDDNGTPVFAGDDFLVGMVDRLDPGQVVRLSRAVILPTQYCSDSSGDPTGMLIPALLPDGNVRVSFIQDPSVNDNTYGANAEGWGGPGKHLFKNLTGSDKAEFEFRNGMGQVVLRIIQDYISESSGFPSGYGSLGVVSGEGKVVVGDATLVLSATTSLSENLNRAPFLSDVNRYTTDSPSPADPNLGLWESRMIYTVVVDGAAFGASGFGGVNLIDQHNSPAKMGKFKPVPCGSCVTNVATAVGRAGNEFLAVMDEAVVCVERPCMPCEGKVSELTFLYHGPAPEAFVEVTQKRGETVFSGRVLQGSTFAFEGTDNGTLGTEILIWVDGVENASLHTSCSKPIGPGMVTGDFTITDAYSKEGGKICLFARCGEEEKFWKKNLAEWPSIFSPERTVASVFSAATGSGAAIMTLKQAVEGKAGSGEEKDLLKHGVAALLNASRPDFSYPMTASEVIRAVDAALLDGDKKTLKTLKDLFKGQNKEENCAPVTRNCIDVSQRVACLLPNDQCGMFATMATGVRSVVSPGFCYEITVSNCMAVALNDVMVVDDRLGDLSEAFFGAGPRELSAGESITRFVKMAWDADTTNTVTASARPVSAGSFVASDQARAIALVESASLNCEWAVESDDDLSNGAVAGRILLPPDGLPHGVVLTLRVCNDGEVDLDGLQLSVSELAGLGCAPVAPFGLAAGECVTVVVCAGDIICANGPLVVEAVLMGGVNGGYCGYDFGGEPIGVAARCEALIECGQGMRSGVEIRKSADRTEVAPGGVVTYFYEVENSGETLLTDIEVMDDNGTPGVGADDFVVGTIGSLAPGARVQLEASLRLPMQICADDTGARTGMLISRELAGGDVWVSFVQDRGVNDNTYGVNSEGWGGPGKHQFKNLVGSDKAEFEFRDGQGRVVLRFQQDYLSSDREMPSGYGTLGVSGGDGRMLVGDPAHVLAVSTSLADNLNRAPFLGDLGRYTVDSPAASDPNRDLWESRMIYSVVVDGDAFGSSGFGGVWITDQHNSPAKMSKFTPVACGICVTNLAVVTARAGGVNLTRAASAVVCTTNGVPSTGAGGCPRDAGEWKKSRSWPAPYGPEQEVVGLFGASLLHGEVAHQTLLRALEKKEGPKEVRNLLKEAVAAVLNAASATVEYPFTVEEIVVGVNMALSDGRKGTLKALESLLHAANDAKGCGEEPEEAGDCDTGGKPSVLTLVYTGRSCGQATNSQPEGKTSCSGDPAGAARVRIVASDSSNAPEGGDSLFTDVMVDLNGVFEVSALAAGETRFRSNTYLHIYDGATRVQLIQIHTSCSAPLIRGESFGALLLEDYR